MKKSEICKNCKYFQEVFKLPSWRKLWGHSKNELFGECRKHSSGFIVEGWPEVREFYWCGEFKKKGKE